MTETEKEVVLVTGSSGLIGRALTNRLARHFDVVGLDLKKPKLSLASVRHFQVDMTSDASVSKALSEVARTYGRRIASVVHLAAYYSFSGQLVPEHSPLYDEITVEGTRRLMADLIRQGFEVEQFIFSSTMLVHRPAPTGEEVSEDSPVDPSWPYPESKVRAEEVLRLEHDDIPVVNLRIAGVYDDQGHSIPIANHIQRIYERQITSHFFPGDPEHGQAYIHLDDLIDAVYRTILARKRLPKVTTLLIGEDEAMSYNELQEEIGILLHGHRWRAFGIPRLLAKIGSFAQNRLPFMREPFIKPWMIQFADENYDLDITRARELLGWEPRRSLRETLPRIIGALKRDPKKWYRENKLQYPGAVVRGLLQFRKHPWLLATAASGLAIGSFIGKERGREKASERGSARRQNPA